MERIDNIAEKLNIPEEYIECYGKYKAKIEYSYYEKIKERPDGKLILVTSINPTPFGEGKTTQSIGLSMAMNAISKNTIAVLREPSLGPVFGIKGGAVGGGKAIVEPKDDINLHFTGDFHAITSANNLLCAVLDNHIFQGNELQIDPNDILIKRVMDMNDRSLRKIKTGVGKKLDQAGTETGFEITAACELMAILDLAKDEEDLKKRINQMTIAYNKKGEAVYTADLGCCNAMLALLQKAIHPNLIQTSEQTPCIMHLGPFANIAHGCNSLIATKMGLKLAEYVVTEAGFGADLGAEKFFDIKCRIGELHPDLAVIVATVNALKYNGGVSADKLACENIEALKKGICNLEKHIENIKKFGVPALVCINRFATDTEEEILYIKEFVSNMGVQVEVSTAFAEGSKGAIALAKLVCNTLETKESHFHMLYQNEEDIFAKIDAVCTQIYGAKDVVYGEGVSEKIMKIQKMGYISLPICIAKVPSSLSDDPSILGRPTGFTIHIRDVKLNSGAGFIVLYAGNIMTMPGLGKNNCYEKF